LRRWNWRLHSSAKLSCDADDYLARSSSHYLWNGLSATQLNATANYPGTFTYTPTTGTVLASGTHSLSVSFAPTDTTNVLSEQKRTRSLSIARRPRLVGVTPAAVSAGTALSATQ
jgi:hypothetical protein